MGKLKQGVTSGFCDDAFQDADRRIQALPALNIATNPYFDTPLRGHDRLIFRMHDAGMYDWMAADVGAREEALRTLGIDPSIGKRTPRSKDV